jgi:hypothetical protein
MFVYETDCYMPIEMLDLIAAVDVKAYRAMLAIPLFARSLSICKVVDFMIAFGYSVVITKYHTIWYLNGNLHRVDGPAVEFANGDKEWYLNGKRHRVDEPSIEYANGDKIWCLNEEPHRVDGPAMEYANGDKEWYLNGKLHRQARNGEPVGPAVERANDGDKEWWLDGELHRVDGPAIEFASGDKEWWLNGIRQPDQ